MRKSKPFISSSWSRQEASGPSCSRQALLHDTDTRGLRHLLRKALFLSLPRLWVWPGWPEPPSLHLNRRSAAANINAAVTSHTQAAIMAVYSHFKCKTRDSGDVGLIPLSERSPGGGNSNLPQSSCLENPRDRGPWWAAVCGVTQSRIRLKQLGSSSSMALGLVRVLQRMEPMG